MYNMKQGTKPSMANQNQDRSHGSSFVTDQTGSSRMDTILKMLLITFICLLAFSSGVYFGKHLSDSEYQYQTLKGNFNHDTDVAQGEGATTADGEKAELNPEDAIAEEETNAVNNKLMNSARDEVKSEVVSGKTEGKKEEAQAATERQAEHQAEHQPASVAEKASTEKESAKTAESAPQAAKPKLKAVAVREGHAETKPDLSASMKAASRIARNASPEEPAKKVESRVPSSLPKTVGSTADVEFTVQVASYPTAEAAKEHADELVKKGFPAFPVEANVGGKTWYRVSVGSFKSQKEATLYRAELLKQTSVASAIVQKIQR